MTRDELKAELTPIVLEPLTKDERSQKLAPIARKFMDARREANIDDTFDIWNDVMVEIVDEHNLRRH